MKIINRSIRLKLIVIVAIAVLVSVVLATLASTWRETTRYSEAKSSELEGVALAFAAGVAEPLAQKNKSNVLKTLRAIGRIPGIVYIRILDKNGQRFAEMGSAVVLNQSGGSNSGKENLSPLDLLLGSHLEIRADIINGGEKIGTMNLLADTSDLRDRLVSGLADALISAMLAMLLGITLTARLHRVLTGPIHRLTTAMAKVRATHDFSQRVDKSTQDETGILVDAFNDMLDQIGMRDKKLIEHQDHLESTVDERTRDLKLAKNAAETANAAKSEFLATMSHEIRTPMNGMLVMSELLATAELSQRHRRYAEVIMRSGQSLLSIINDILDFSKIEAGRLELEKVPVDPSVLIDDVLNLFWERATSKNLDLAAYISPQVANQIEGDPVRINQVLSNLVNNALKFTETGYVFVTVDVDHEPATSSDALKLRFSVSDTGIGIAEDKISSVFDSFSQADQSTTRKYGGTGLGLAICKKLVTAMQGEMDLVSKLGEGSTFSFTMTTRALGKPVEIVTPNESKLKSTAILLKSPGARRALKNYLESSGIKVTQLNPSNPDHAQMAGVGTIFADAEIIQQFGGQGGLALTGEKPTLVCVSKLGDALSESLIRSGRADDILMLPIARTTINELVLRLIDDQPLGLSAIEHRVVPQAATPSFKGVKVLVADDSPVNREVIIEALTRMDINVRTVENGEQAVQAVENDNYDLVFMDCSMPVMDGYAATKKIRQAEELQQSSQRLPIVALTAHVAGGPVNEWQNAGMDDFISKPFKIQTLIKCFETWLVKGADDQQPVMENVSNDQAGIELSREDQIVANDTPFIDQNIIAGIKEINPDEATEMIKRIFELYEAHAPQALTTLENTLQEKAPKPVADAAHALKSLSSSIGAERVHSACEKLEKQARNNDLSSSARQFEIIASELSQTLETINTMKNHDFG